MCKQHMFSNGLQPCLITQHTSVILRYPERACSAIPLCMVQEMATADAAPLDIMIHALSVLLLCTVFRSHCHAPVKTMTVFFETYQVKQESLESSLWAGYKTRVSAVTEVPVSEDVPAV